MYSPSVIAGIDSENQVRIEIEIRGLYKNVSYGAILDTGFSGGLLLPLITAVDVGLERAGGGSVVLADGTIKTLPIFLCRVKLGGRINDVSTIVMGNEVLIGMELINNYHLCVSGGKGVVTVDEEEDMAANYINFDNLTGMIRNLTGGGY
uniref:Aspartyl protease n=1 Tax=viral metagenome TaxID=1070528 RepID=A0A6M3II58_9ZZZZ